MLKTYLAVMLGGAAGTGVRMWISTLLTLRYGEAFPVGTLIVNVTGSFIIGLFGGLTGPQGSLPASPLLRTVMMVGFLGGYTTFSSFSLQTLTLLNHGAWARAGLNALLSLGLCLGAVWLGHVLASALNQAR